MKKQSRNYSRRDFLRITRNFGITSTLMAMAAFAPGDNFSTLRLADAAALQEKKRSAKNTRVTLVYGLSVKWKDWEHIDPIGCLHFVRDLEDRTDGEIRVEIIDQNTICNQFDCIKRAQSGIIDIYCSTTQNAAESVPFFNILDFPYMFPGRASQQYFFYHPKSNKLLREPLIKQYGIRFLFTNCRLRELLMGMKWRKKPDITTIEELSGMTIRVTASKPGKLALELLNMKPIPIPWEETLGALKYGMVDGMEGYSSAVAAEFPEVISQVVNLRLFSANEHTGINERVFEKLTPDLQYAVMESAYQTQMATEVACFNTVGASLPMKQDTIFAKHGIRFVELPVKELEKAEKICSPLYNPKPWESWREKLNKLAGDIDIYQEIFNIAREIPADTLAQNIDPRRWWKYEK
ncbi:Twin-arginine translocation pathway signal [Desulfamplus magnetovallimortis]|uniref:Twin-arginine translocation pathway signal n=1 Tax=Desulfamplus magnetovallimortis TaxID=1246637 RepID=A0A1W1H718_9BACT|nr:TRAP transporter substrate-binding protein DctP [Desulfamplus magnetovallimortis]SLM28178.1 Twin-arginine translocation pathway signal [Desulfamplus magnetovallimortis]